MHKPNYFRVGINPPGRVRRARGYHAAAPATERLKYLAGVLGPWAKTEFEDCNLRACSALIDRFLSPGAEYLGTKEEESMDPFLSEIRLFACNFVPKGWAACNGALLPIAQNTALFSLVGTMYGGDGRTNFGLPDLRGKSPLPADAGVYCIAVQGVFPERV